MSVTDVELADDALPPEILTAEEIAARRRFCTWLQHWRDCGVPQCRRAHTCKGDSSACFFSRWPGYSALARVWIEAGLYALEEGLTAREAAQAADFTLLQYVKKAEGLPILLPRRKKWRWAEAGGEPL
jgi:hypothetical protein